MPEWHFGGIRGVGSIMGGRSAAALVHALGAAKLGMIRVEPVDRSGHP
jgi:hypothetical protein